MDKFVEPKSRVYILVDSKNRVLRVEGEYTLPTDLTNWILIDEGYGDRFNLAQAHYFALPICDEMGLHNYMYDNGTVREATATELEAELRELPKNYTETLEERVTALEGELANVDETLIELFESFN